MNAPRAMLLALAAVVGCSDPPERFDRPTGVAFGAGGEAYVADGYDNARVVRFSEQGDFELEWGGRGSAPGQFRTPHSICVDASQRIYVADRENARIQVFDREGTFLAAWTSSTVGRPWGVACGRDGAIYVCDGGDQDPERPRGSVMRLDPDGRVVARFVPVADAPFNEAHSLAVDAQGAVFVAEADGRRLRKLVPRP